jgi:hypothetical protein
MTTNGHIPRHRQYSLTLKQRTAIDLLLAGKNDREVAEHLGADRSTITKWRLYDPQFQVALDRRRAELWPVASDYVRALLPTALATMDEQLRVGPNRGRLALDFVVRAGLLGKPYSGTIATAGIGPTSMDQLLDREVRRHRAASRAGAPPGDGAPDDDTPITPEERAAAYDRLMARLDQPDAVDPDDPDYPDAPDALADPASVAVSAPSAVSPEAPPPPVSAATRTMSSFR